MAQNSCCTHNRTHISKFFENLWTGLLCAAFFLSVPFSAYAAGSNGAGDGDSRILFLSSYSYGWDTVQMQIEGIKDGVHANTVVDYEFMDTKRVNDETSAELFYEGFRYRLNSVERYDAVILGDDAALLFALQYQQELFNNIPLIFEGVNDEKLAAKAAEDPMITGIVEKLSLAKNLELAASLMPEARNVVAILDDTVTGEAERKKFYEMQENYPNLTFSEINCSVLTEEGIKKKLQALGSDTILIFIVMTANMDGELYTGQEAIRLISENANVPCFRMVEAGIGDGLLGGNVVSMYESGRNAAQIAMRVIGGESCSDISLQESPNIFCLDEAVMRKFNIPLKSIPQGVRTINHKNTVWENYHRILPAMLIPLAILLVFLGILLYDNRSKHKEVTELSDSNDKLQYDNIHDYLTRLQNREAFRRKMERLMEDRRTCAIMMLDIDNFKHINDAYTHASGDEILKKIADVLRQVTAEVENEKHIHLRAYRYAGDEFMILTESDDEELQKYLAEKCQSGLAGIVIERDPDYRITCSMGGALFPSHGVSVEKLVARADACMYEVKQAGKNGYRV